MPEVLLPGFFWIFAIVIFPRARNHALLACLQGYLPCAVNILSFPHIMLFAHVRDMRVSFLRFFLFSWFISTVYLHVSIIQINKKCALPEIPWKVKLLFPRGTFRAQMKVAPTPNAD